MILNRATQLFAAMCRKIVRPPESVSGRPVSSSMTRARESTHKKVIVVGGSMRRWAIAAEEIGRGRFRAVVSISIAVLGTLSMIFLPDRFRPEPVVMWAVLSLGLALGLSTAVKFMQPIWDRFGGIIGLSMVTLVAAVTGGGESPYVVLYLISILYEAILQSRRRLIVESVFMALCVAVLLLTSDEVSQGTVFSAVLRTAVLLFVGAVVHALVGQLRRMASKLEASEQQYRSLVLYNPDAVHTFDLQWRFRSANPAAAAVSGYTPEELNEMRDIPLQALLAPDSVEETLKHLIATAEGRPQHFETTIINREGQRVELQTATVPMIVDDKVVGVYSVSKDITDRKRAERLLRERAAQQAAVGRLGQSALVTADLAALLNETARLAAETMGVPLAAVYELHGDDQALVSAGVGWQPGVVGVEIVPMKLPYDTGLALQADGPYAVSDYVLVDDGRPTPLVERHDAGSGMGVALRSNEAVFGLLAVYDFEPRDFTTDEHAFLQTMADVLASAISRRRVEQQLLQGQKLQAVGRLAGGIAHDFNNLLTAMLGYVELLAPHVSGDAQAREHLQEALQAGGRARALVDQILTFSRGRVSVAQRCSLNSHVRDMRGLLRQLIPAGVTIEMDLPDPLGVVRIDPSQLQQVVLNLAVNAGDAMPSGGVLRLSTSEVRLDHAAAERIGLPAGHYVTLVVEDSGEGMDAVTAARLFEPFFTTKPSGTGLGLATVYGVVTAAGGQVRVESQLGHGSRFTVYLPWAADASELPPTLTVNGTSPAVPAALAPAGGATILVVEDQAAVRSLVAEILVQRGYTVLQATNGVEAAELAQQRTAPIDLLVTDVVMPQLQGPELAQALRQRWPGLRVLYMSGYSARPEILAGHDDDADFLAKPFGIADLVTRITKLLARPATVAGR